MNWFYDAKLATKLLLAFVLCALITLAMGILGIRGIEALSSSLQQVTSNNMVSVDNLAGVRFGLVAQNRYLYRLNIVVGDNAPQSDRDHVLTQMRENREISEKAFALYRATVLQEDELAPIERIEKTFPAYQTQIDKAVALLSTGDLAAAARFSLA